REGAGEGAPAVVPQHRGPRAVGEHHEREGASAGARRDLAELAACLRRERRPPEGEGTLRPPPAPNLPRPVRGGRLSAPRGAAARARSLRERPEPGGRAHLQGDDRDPAEVRRETPGEPRRAQGAVTPRARVAWRAGAGR